MFLKCMLLLKLPTCPCLRISSKTVSYCKYEMVTKCYTDIFLLFLEVESTFSSCQYQNGGGSGFEPVFQVAESNMNSFKQFDIIFSYCSMFLFFKIMIWLKYMWFPLRYSIQKQVNKKSKSVHLEKFYPDTAKKDPDPQHCLFTKEP